MVSKPNKKKRYKRKIEQMKLSNEWKDLCSIQKFTEKFPISPIEEKMISSLLIHEVNNQEIVYSVYRMSET